MKERPILFSGPMVKAILKGCKTQTRRVVKLPLHCQTTGCELNPGELSEREIHSLDTLCPHGGPSDRLWVREKFQLWDHSIETVNVVYDVGDDDERDKYVDFPSNKKPKSLHRRNMDGRKPWRPGIFMPRWASRITLEIASVRVERLQDISANDCICEGINYNDHRCGCEVCSLVTHICPATSGSLIDAFHELWDSINGKRHPWAGNPWVWVITFKQLL